MSFLLHIDTAVQSASVCLAADAQPLSLEINPDQKEGAAWLHTAVEAMLKENGLAASRLDAISVSAGPGSYTGLRVGMAAAKGLCFALNIPLILVNSLQMMAAAATAEKAALLCPMIDARRMEVFTGVFDKSLETVVPASNLILENHDFDRLLESHTICFFGNGSTKFRTMMQSPNASFANIEANASHLSSLAYKKFRAHDFADLAYSEPFYGKDFHSPAKQSL
ncbi:MAG TPA: tRNA (adenosine(37)-N6)-threonylcarbamoyltransferase complex dimerization subunit type 1 TsaB [Flavisolibacter sp.]|nr:tRNA (adenosine(37)-N6)-threonylcarbamoyltransferase complex dimerization subunit type 1 TsaB [Flavisolibacter sp.]